MRDTMTNHAHDIGQILDKKIKCCENFLSATLLLKEALETEEMASVDHLIGHRQKLIRVIDRMDRLTEYYRHVGPPDKNQRIEILSEKLKEILKQIMSANHDCDAIATAKGEGLRKNIINIRHEKEGIHGYSRLKEQTQKFLNIQT